MDSLFFDFAKSYTPALICLSSKRTGLQCNTGFGYPDQKALTAEACQLIFSIL